MDRNIENRIEELLRRILALQSDLSVADCFARQIDDLTQHHHDCVTLTDRDLADRYFDQAFEHVVTQANCKELIKTILLDKILVETAQTTAPGPCDSTTA